MRECAVLVPGWPSDASSPGGHPDCNLMGDPEPESPNTAILEFLTPQKEIETLNTYCVKPLDFEIVCYTVPEK